MTEPVKSDYADLLNALVDMQGSPAYALRRRVLERAESVIIGLEQENRQLKALLEKEKAEPLKTTIDGYEVEMMDCDGCMGCFVSSEQHHAAAGLASLVAEGVLTPYNGAHGADHPVASATIDRIVEWATAHGY
jgi:hypothetical protein